MQNFVARAMVLIAFVAISAVAYAQSSDTKEHKGLPPICQGEANRFNCASATIDGQSDAPAVDAWGRSVAPPAKRAKSAPAARHDLSGIWQVDGVDEFGFRGILGIFGAPALPSDGYPDHEPPYTKEGLEAYHRHKPVFGVDAVPAAQSNDPVKSCDPPGFPRSDLHSLSTMQILQTPVQMVVLYARYKNWRMIWADGRELPQDPDPTWDGYSVGKWVDDTTFVVQSNGTDERTWLDNAGRPHSDALRVEERFHRVDRDHMELTVTLNDPKMYARPWVALDKQPFRLMPADFAMSETRCSPSEMAAYDSLVSAPISK
ncbi:MAG TPA: hypothetical protein VFB23_01575 [Candidatus Acidoferrales bacterium]|nr:hypothetical protein [Candidatus Acidoferrales bacterium]